MTTFLTAVKLTYTWEDCPEYWGPVQDLLSAEFGMSKLKTITALTDYIKGTYGVDMWRFTAEHSTDTIVTRRIIVFDSEASKLMFALKFPGLPDVE
jgi:hypothetical protein